jgi:hypothetical protein
VHDHFTRDKYVALRPEKEGQMRKLALSMYVLHGTSANHDMYLSAPVISTILSYRILKLSLDVLCHSPLMVFLPILHDCA